MRGPVAILAALGALLVGLAGGAALGGMLGYVAGERAAGGDVVAGRDRAARPAAEAGREGAGGRRRPSG
ncbi:MAG: hypothetical protein U0470_11305 [Anaerolineae bacterium]